MMPYLCKALVCLAVLTMLSPNALAECNYKKTGKGTPDETDVMACSDNGTYTLRFELNSSGMTAAYDVRTPPKAHITNATLPAMINIAPDAGDGHPMHAELMRTNSNTMSVVSHDPDAILATIDDLKRTSKSIDVVFIFEGGSDMHKFKPIGARRAARQFMQGAGFGD